MYHFSGGVMRLLCLILIAIYLIGCEDEQSDTTPPTVSISSPVSGQTIFEIVTISVTTQDNEGIDRVQFFVDDSLRSTDTSPPYEYNWNTTLYENGSEHVISATSFDTSDNFTESQPILLIVDNTNSTPQPINVTSVTYDFEYMTVSWEESTESDFGEYRLLHAEQEAFDRDTVAMFMDIETTSYQISGFDPTHTNYFWIMVSDTLGLNSIGSGLSNQVDDPPAEPVLYPIAYEDGQFQIVWSQNHEHDFDSYTLFESDSPDMQGEIEIGTFTNPNDTCFLVDGVVSGDIRFYQVVAQDHWGLMSSSNIEEGNTWIRFSIILGSGNESDNGESVQLTSDGGYVVAGQTRSFGNGLQDFWLIKIDSLGTEEWNQTFGGNYTDWGISVIEALDGGFVICGYTQSYGSGQEDVWLVKTDSFGNEEWNRTYGGMGLDIGYYVDNTNDGGYIITGRTCSYGYGGFNDVWLIKVDAQGNHEWDRTFGESEFDSGYAVSQTSDGGYIITGTTRSYGNGESDVWLIKTDTEGIEEWNQTYGGEESDDGYDVKQKNNGGYVIVGSTRSFPVDGSCDVWLIGTDSQGIEEWSNTFGEGNASGRSVAQTTSDYGFIVTGGSHRDWLFKTDPVGNLEWSQDYSSQYENFYGGESVCQTLDGGFIVTGTMHSNSESDFLWIVKTDPFGNTVPLD